MKFFYLIAIILLVSMNLRAQTNAPTWIDSDSAVFDLAGHQATYCGHVIVRDPGMSLKCEWLVIDLPLPQAGGRVSHIVAETNVVIDLADDKGQTNHATGDLAVYDYTVRGSVTNETVTLTGDHPKIENSMGTQSGDKIIWDKIANKFHFTNPIGTLRQNLNGAAVNTNPPAANTNLPPGTIQNIDRISSPTHSF